MAPVTSSATRPCGVIRARGMGNRTGRRRPNKGGTALARARRPNNSNQNNGGEVTSTSTSTSTSTVQAESPLVGGLSLARKATAGAPLVSQLVFSVSVIACSLSVATAALICSLIPAIKSLKQAAEEIALLARVLREETPDTLAAVRLSGVEISDCVEEIGELSNDLTRGLRTSARTIVATSGAVKDGAYYVKDNVYPVVKERVVPAATNTMKTVLRKRADMNNYDRPVVAMAASRTAKVIKGIRSLILARNAYEAVDGSLPSSPAERESGEAGEES